MSKFNDTTGDRLSNTLKGDREAYAKGWDRVFNKEEALDELVEINQETGQYYDVSLLNRLLVRSLQYELDKLESCTTVATESLKKIDELTERLDSLDNTEFDKSKDKWSGAEVYTEAAVKESTKGWRKEFIHGS